MLLMKEKIKLLYQMDQISHFNRVVPLTLSTEEKSLDFHCSQKKNHWVSPPLGIKSLNKHYFDFEFL